MTGAFFGNTFVRVSALHTTLDMEQLLLADFPLEPIDAVRGKDFPAGGLLEDSD